MVTVYFLLHFCLFIYLFFCIYLGWNFYMNYTRTIPNRNTGGYKSCEGGSLVEVDP